jgi:hypothetical protein
MADALSEETLVTALSNAYAQTTVGCDSPNRRGDSGPAICITVVLLAILAIWPFCEMSLIDDWSFAYMALKASHTGHLIYNGWSTPMVGVQAFWGAAWIGLGGFSFNLLRFSTIPFVTGCTVLLYRLMQSCGLTRSFVIFGTLAVMLSPLMLPVEASFMTDVPALFFLLLCFWCCQRILEARTWGAFLGWATLCFLSGLSGGTIRQTNWLAPFVIFPVLTLMAPRSRRLILLSFWIAGGAGAAALYRWFLAQPHCCSMPLFSTDGWLIPAESIVLNMGTLFMELLALMLPVLFLTLRLKPRRLRLKWIVAALLLFGLILLPASLLRKEWPIQLIAGDMVTQWGLLRTGTEILGQKVIVLAYPFQLSIVIGATVLWIMLASVRPRMLFSLLRESSTISSRAFLVPFVAFAGIYLLALTSRATRSAFDRYLIPVLPLALLLTLMAIQRLGIRTLSILPIAYLCISAGWGVASVHDYFAESRARLKAANRVLRSGVPREQISAGFEFDGWAELQKSEHIPDVPVGNSSIPGKRIMPSPYWFWVNTPSLNPRYILSLSRLDGLRDSEFPPVEYRTWLPPFTGSILIQRTGL